MNNVCLIPKNENKSVKRIIVKDTKNQHQSTMELTKVSDFVFFQLKIQNFILIIT